MSDTSAIHSDLTKKYAYSYERWSSAQQSLGSSKYRQDGDAESICKQFGLTLIDTIRDKGITAKDGSNLVAEFARLSQVVKAGEYVIIEDASRISRAGQIKGILAINELVEKGIILLIGRCSGKPLEVNRSNLEDDEIWPALSNELKKAKDVNTYTTKGKIAAWAMKKEAMSRGEKVRLYSVAPWLKNSPKDILPITYTVDEGKCAVLRRIFKSYAQGVGLTEIVRKLNQDGSVNIFSNDKTNGKCGKRYHVASLGRIIRDKRVMGYSEIVQPPVKIFPEVVDEETFWKCQAIRDSHINPRFHGRQAIHVNLFGGLAVCSHCQSGMQTRVYKYKLKDKPLKTSGHLYCYGVKLGICEVKKSFRLSQLDESFVNILSRFASLKAMVMAEEDIIPSRIPEIESRLKRNATGRVRLYDIIKQMDAPPKDIHLQLQASQREEDELAREIDKENARLLGIKPLVQALQTYHERLTKGFRTNEDRLEIRELIREVVEKLEVDATSQSYKVWVKNINTPIEVQLKRESYFLDGIEFKYIDESNQPHEYTPRTKAIAS